MAALPLGFLLLSAVGSWVHYALANEVDKPGPHPANPNPDRIRLSAIGWTQDSVRHEVYNTTVAHHREINEVVDAALSSGDALSYLEVHFPEPIRVYYHQTYGYLSLDNRRLTVFRLALPPETEIRVRILTEQQAGEELARHPDPDAASAAQALRRRLTTNDGGYSIRIRGDGTIVDRYPSTVISHKEL